MLEPVGGKLWEWHREGLKCPTKENPYIYTSKNSPKRFESIPDTKSKK